ncbi:MAG: lipopolysaccharide assembly protein LapA domain-containing protein [Dokdonella sp.]
MRLLIVLLTVVFAGFGAVFGALNSDWISLDLYLRTLSVPKGASLLLMLLIGWLLGGVMVWLANVPRLRRELRRARQRQSQPASARKATDVGSGGNE